MKLTLRERQVLKMILPTEGHFSDLVEYRKLKELLDFTVEEVKEFDIQFFQNGQITWNHAKAATYLKDIACTEWVTTEIQSILRNREREGKLLEQELTLYEKFIVYYNNLQV